MKLLFDQNLSPKLAVRLDDLFPGSSHLQNVGLDRVPDTVIWDFARQHDFAIVSKDADFNTLSVLRGHPPKVIWLLLGNCHNSAIESLFRARAVQIIAFEADPTAGTLALS